MARQAHTVCLRKRTRFGKGLANSRFVLRLKVAHAVRKGGVIHEREHTAADAEEVDAVGNIPLEDGQQIRSVPSTQFTHTLKREPVHTQSTVGEKPILCLASRAQGQVLTGVAEVTNHVCTVHQTVFLSSGQLDGSILFLAVSFFNS